MNNQLFAGFALILIAGIMHFNSMLQNHFSPVDVYQEKVSWLEEELQRQYLENEMIRYEVFEFQQEVAAILPDVLKGTKKSERYPLRTLASVVQNQSAEEIKKGFARTLFEQGRSHFKAKRYESAVEVLDKLVEEYSFSVHVVEAQFLLVESHFQMNKYEQSVRHIQDMVQLFPGSELTGFALVRLGTIFEVQQRPHEAVEIYQTVLKTYPHTAVANQAWKSMRAVDI